SGDRLLHNERLSIASSSLGSTPSASIIALTPESDIISAIVGLRFQFEQPARIGACTALIRLADETAAFCNLNFGFPTESCFGPYIPLGAISRKLLGSSQHFSKKNRSESKPWFRALCFCWGRSSSCPTSRVFRP